MSRKFLLLIHHSQIVRCKKKNVHFFFSASHTASNSKLQGYSGFDPMLCYGDILLSYGWISNRPSPRHTGDSGKKENTETTRAQPTISTENPDKKMHDFIRTHFHRATHCDFCSKKVSFGFPVI